MQNRAQLNTQDDADREGVGLQDAMRHARAVLQVLREAISEGEINKIKTQLPSDFDVLFA